MRYLYFFVIFFFSCSASDLKPVQLLEVNQSDNIWSIDTNDLSVGSPFTLINSPDFKSVNEIEYLNDESKILLVKINNEIRGYPYLYTNYSEVVNDFFNNINLVVSYCPQTKSGVCFNSSKNLIASGYLYKDNMVLSNVDRNEFWSQMLLEKIEYDNYNDLIFYNSVETKFKTVKEHFSNAKIYYHDNLNSSNKYVSNHITSRIEARMFGVINKKEQVKVELFSYAMFEKKNIYRITVEGKKTVVVGDFNNKIINAYFIPDNLIFQRLSIEDFPRVLKDNEGNVWDIFGYCVSGKRIGEKLGFPKSYLAELWAWKDFFENINVHN